MENGRQPLGKAPASQPRGRRSFFCFLLRVLKTGALVGAAASYLSGGVIPAIVLWISLVGYATAFVGPFLIGCRRDCPEAGLLPVLDFTFAVLLAAATGGLDGRFVVACAFVIGLNAFCMGVLRAALYGGAAATVLLLLHAGSGLDRWPHALGVAAFFPAIALVMSVLGRSRTRANTDRTRLERELAEESLQIQHQKQRVEELLHRLQAVEDLASMGRTSAEIVHQVRDPLGAISLNLEMLEEDLEQEGLTSDEVREALTRIENEVATLGDLAENYLQYARLPTPRCRVESVNDIVSEVLRQEMPHLARSRVTVHYDLPAHPQVYVDRRQIKFALHNLIENAREAMAEGGRLKLATGADNGSVRVRIGDTGDGISSEDLSHVFDAFFTTKRHGTGLGLSLARKIVEQHGGRLCCTSLPDVGTTFEIVLDAADREETT